MGKPIKKPNKTNPESYSPKTLKLANMMEQAGIDMKKIKPQYLIDAVFPTGDNPWVGGCDYLRCFTSLYMHLEGMPPAHSTRYWLYRKFLAVTGMGMVTTFTDKPDEHNYSFEAAHDYIGRLQRFAGYGYYTMEAAGQDKNELFKVISYSIHLGRPVFSVYPDGEKMYKFNRKWRLFVGYDYDNMTLSINEDGTAVILPDWFERLDSIIIITQTGLPRADIKDVLREIIVDAEREKSQDEKYGCAAYEELISRLSDVSFFKNADETTLEQFNKSLGSFFWYHAESRGATGEGYDQLCGQELDGTEYKTDAGCNRFWGYNGHQISYIGCTALRKGAAALREKKHRDILIYGLRMLMSNDAKIINMIKHSLNINTPDVLFPKDEAGQPVDYCQRSKAMLTWDSKNLFDNRYSQLMNPLDAGSILSECKVTDTHTINFSNDAEAIDTELKILEEGLLLKNTGSEWDMTGRVHSKQTFRAPLKIEACIENKEAAAFGLFFNEGFIKSSNWADVSGQLVLRDIYMNYAMDFWSGLNIPPILTDEIKITWILQRNYTAVIVNEQLIHYIENLPYTHFEMLQSAVGVGAFKDQSVILKALSVSELE